MRLSSHDGTSPCGDSCHRRETASPDVYSTFVLRLRARCPRRRRSPVVADPSAGSVGPSPSSARGGRNRVVVGGRRGHARVGVDRREAGPRGHGWGRASSARIGVRGPAATRAALRHVRGARLAALTDDGARRHRQHEAEADGDKPDLRERPHVGTLTGRNDEQCRHFQRTCRPQSCARRGRDGDRAAAPAENSTTPPSMDRPRSALRPASIRLSACRSGACADRDRPGFVSESWSRSGFGMSSSRAASCFSHHAAASARLQASTRRHRGSAAARRLRRADRRGASRGRRDDGLEREARRRGLRMASAPRARAYRTTRGPTGPGTRRHRRGR